eukprot:6207886-Pleurochrysis_carterae.AAC.3
MKRAQAEGGRLHARGRSGEGSDLRTPDWQQAGSFSGGARRRETLRRHAHGTPMSYFPSQRAAGARARCAEQKSGQGCWRDAAAGEKRGRLSGEALLEALQSSCQHSSRVAGAAQVDLLKINENTKRNLEVCCLSQKEQVDWGFAG